MAFRSVTPAILRWLPQQDIILKMAWVATMIPLAVFGYLTWKSVALNTEVTQLEEKRDRLIKALNDVQIELERGDVVSAEDTVREATRAEVARGPHPPNTSDRRQAIQQLFDPNAAVRVKAYGELLPRYQRDPSLIPELLDAARADPRNDNGIYNVLVVLSHMNRETVAAHADEVRAFARANTSRGPRVKERAETLLRRLPS